MKRFIVIGLSLVLVLALVGAPTAWAACTIINQPLTNAFSTSIGACPDAQPVAAYAYSLGAPGTSNSGAQPLACNVGGAVFSWGGVCQPEAGIAGDGAVTVFYQWGSPNTGSVGCPNPDRTGEDPVALQITCNDGASVIIVVGYSAGNEGYILEFAYPAATFAINAGFENGPSLASFTAGGATDTVCVSVPDPLVYSDCDPTSAGVADPDFPSCVAGAAARPPITRGDLWFRTAPGAGSPDLRTASGWTKATTQPTDATNPVCNTVPHPAVSTDCTFVGATAKIGGVETAAIVSSLRVCGNAATNDKVKIDNAAFNQGKLIVGFSTINETSIVGFNVYSGATKLNGNLITAKGTGSNGYSFEVGRGALKGGKSVLVEAVKSDGTVEKTAPVTLK